MYDFYEIDRLHSELSRMEKAAKMGWLMGERISLNRLTNQFLLYLYANGGFVNEVEKEYAHKLLEMNKEVDTEDSKVTKDIVDDTFKKLFKAIINLGRLV